MTDPQDATVDPATTTKERPMSRHKTPGRGGSAPAGDRPKRPVAITLDCDVHEAARQRVGPRGLSAEVERLLREANEARTD